MAEREILFRGQTRRKNEWAKMPSSNWVYGGIFVPEDNLNFAIIIAQQENTVEKHSVYGDTVGQYTGLTDKNGVKIFEGDIVKILNFQTGIIINECATFGVGISPFIDWDYLDSEIHTITGCDNNPYFCRNDNFCSLWELMWNYNQGDNDCSVVEVLGNIHDNPELLETAAKPASKNIAQSGLAPATDNFELMEG